MTMLALLTDLQLFLATGFAGMRMSAIASFFFATGFRCGFGLRSRQVLQFTLSYVVISNNLYTE